MTLLICVDDKGGMLFGGKRQSRDRILLQELLSLVGDGRLFMTPYTKTLFENDPRIQVCSAPEKEAGPGDFYFAEDGALPTEGVSRLVLYRWNRRYPGDRFFHPEAWKLTLLQSRDFPGSSHKTITEERYEVQI